MKKKDKGLIQQYQVLGILKILTPQQATKLSMSIKRDPVNLTEILEKIFIPAKFEPAAEKGVVIENKGESTDQNSQNTDQKIQLENIEMSKGVTQFVIETKNNFKKVVESMGKKDLLTNYKKNETLKSSKDKGNEQRRGILVNYKSDF